MTNITPKQLRAIECLMTSPSITAAAEKAGVSRRTLTAWLQNEQFCAELSKRGDEAVGATTRLLASVSASAVGTLATAMREGETHGVRVRAADIALSQLMRIRELHDMEQRIAALEATAKP
jgi:phage terminase small subunit